MASGFWTDGQGQDPKRQYRFVAEFVGLGENGCSWFVKNVGKPNLSISEATHEYLNHTFYYPGRITWNSVSVTFVDPVEPDAAATMMKAIYDAGYRIPTDANDKGTLSKSNSIKALGDVTIKQLDWSGDVELETWKLNNAWIKSVSLSGLDYGGDSLSEVTLELRYDWASLTKHGTTGNDLGANTGLWTL